MEYILPQCFGHSPVTLIGVHNSGENILFATHDLYGCPVSVLIKSLGKLIPAMVIEVGGVYIKNQFPVKVGICFQATSGDYALLLHLGKHLCIPGGRFLKMDVLRCVFWYNIWVGIGFLFSFVVPLGISDFGGSQVYVSCTGTVNPVVSRHRAPFTFVRPAGRGALPAEV